MGLFLSDFYWFWWRYSPAISTVVNVVVAVVTVVTVVPVVVAAVTERTAVSAVTVRGYAVTGDAVTGCQASVTVVTVSEGAVAEVLRRGARRHGQHDDDDREQRLELELDKLVPCFDLSFSTNERGFLERLTPTCTSSSTNEDVGHPLSRKRILTSCYSVPQRKENCHWWTETWKKKRPHRFHFAQV